MTHRISVRAGSRGAVVLLILTATLHIACSSGVAPGAAEARIEAEARREAERFWSSNFARCGDSYYRRAETKSGTYVVEQFREPRVEVSARSLSEAERLNGIEWRGATSLAYGAKREYGSQAGRWYPWRDGGGAGLTYRMTKTNGRWEVDARRLPVVEEAVRYAPADCSNIPE